MSAIFSKKILFCLNLFTVSVLCLTADEIEAQNSGWNLNPNTQYHIQTDEGSERYFRFQTLNGQYRKEKRLADGTVIGTEGWLDPLGYLRLKDYVADHEGFRILKSKIVYVGKDRPMQDALAEAKKVPAQNGLAVRPRRPPNPFRRRPESDLAPLSGNEIETNPPYSVIAKPRTSDAPSYRRNQYYYRQQPRPQTRPSVSPYSESELQSLDTFSRPRYYSNELPRAPTRVLQAPAFNDNSPYRNDYPSINNPPQPAASTPIRADDDYPPYDGVHTSKNGFQYYLRRQYHEEEREPSTDDRVGSFGYVDPFGIRRVIYYKTDPRTGGFIHKKNNRYVGFASTPYDPSPPPSKISPFNRRRRANDTASSTSTT